MENTSAYKRNMNIDSLKDKRIWFMISGQKVSGSESRAVKVASYFAKKNIFKEVIFACNKELLDEYKKNKVLSRLLAESGLTIIEKNKHENILLSNEKFNSKMLKKYLNLLFNGGKILPSLYRRFILLFSWKNFIKQNIDENDIVHGIYGMPVRIAVWELSQYLNNTFVIEITGPRRVKRYKYYLNALYSRNNKSKNLHFFAVTKTNYEIYKDFIGEEFFNRHNINFSYYEGPFVSIPGDVKIYEKENIIIFPHRFFGRKNAPLFSKAVKKLFDEGTLNGWKVLFRGKGEDESVIRTTLKKYIESGCVEVGYSNNIAEDFAKSKICVSIISTDNIPSNSIYESLKHGNLQVLSDTGNTKKVLNHPHFFFCQLDQESLCNALKGAVDTAISKEFHGKSDNMRSFYKYMEENNLYVKKALEVYTK